jgi:hypothetical protein
MLHGMGGLMQSSNSQEHKLNTACSKALNVLVRQIDVEIKFMQLPMLLTMLH